MPALAGANFAENVSLPIQQSSSQLRFRMALTNPRSDRMASDAELCKESLHLLFHEREFRQDALSFINLTLEIVSRRQSSALDFRCEIARARRTRLADADRLRVRFQNLSELLALLSCHSLILS